MNIWTRHMSSMFGNIQAARVCRPSRLTKLAMSSLLSS